jgi:hypothetical protein
MEGKGGDEEMLCPLKQTNTLSQRKSAAQELTQYPKKPANTKCVPLFLSIVLLLLLGS